MAVVVGKRQPSEQAARVVAEMVVTIQHPAKLEQQTPAAVVAELVEIQLPVVPLRMAVMVAPVLL